jgi:hypothetical protein
LANCSQAYNGKKLVSHMKYRLLLPISTMTACG